MATAPQQQIVYQAPISKMHKNAMFASPRVNGETYGKIILKSSSIQRSDLNQVIMRQSEGWLAM